MNTGRILVRAGAAAGGAAGLAYLEHTNPKMKKVAGIDSGLVIGGALAVLAPMLMTGRTGRVIGEVGVGAFAVGVNRVVATKLAEKSDDAEAVSGLGDGDDE